ncbi:hypothetical protein VTP01DRAFT_8908 [Rhizomucor pusillus]|uniref:uncharacterized protein n=1 Tax=Rhizomucor pusillus TaxID=4840 RepID=UPI0037420C3A
MSTIPQQLLSDHPETNLQYQLIVRQQPVRARLCSFKEKVDRRPVDPPPIVQLICPNATHDNYLQDPSFFLYATLATPDGQDFHFSHGNRTTAGSVVQSLHKLKDINDQYGGFFIFADISVRHEGQFKLKFTLFRINQNTVQRLAAVYSDVFTVHSPKNFPGMSESSVLTRCFSDQGVRIRVRKEARSSVSAKRRRVAATTDGGREHSDDTPCTTPRCEAAAPITPLPAQFQYDFSEGTSRQHAATRPPAIPSPLPSPAPPTAGVYSSPMPPPLRLQGVSSSSHAMSMRNLLVSEDKEQCAPPTYPPRPAPPLASLSAPNILAQPSSIQLPSISILAPLEETPPRYFLSSPPTPHIPPSDQQTLQAYHQHIVRPSSSEPTTSDRSADRRTDNNIQSGFPHRM